MTKIFVVCVVLLMAASIFAQAPAEVPAPKPAPSATPTPEANGALHFELSTGYEKLMSGGQATVIRARLPLTPRWSAGYEQIQIPSAAAQVFLGGVEIREVLGHLIKSQASKVNLNAIQVYAQAGFGTKRDSLGNNPSLAYGFKGGTDFPLGTIGGGTLAAGVSFGYIGVPNQPSNSARRFVFGSTVSIAPQLSLRF